jgi:hypothetical protein
MRKLLIAVALLGSVLSAPVLAKPSCKHETIEQLVKALGEAYDGKSLGSLDTDKPFAGKFRIVIEHSLADDNARDRFVIKWFTSLRKAESWLKSREHEEMPARSTRPLVKCAKGVCTYDFDGGILHNNLYLKKITYGIRNGCPYLKTIYLLDGD